MKTKKENIIILICFLVIILSIVLFFFISSSNRIKNSFKFNEHLEDNVVTIENTNNTSSCSIRLKEFSYYILVMEASVNQTAGLYNPNNLHSYWNLYISNTFVKSEAKNTTMDMCVRDNIYYIEAVEDGFSLTSDEEITVTEEASYIYKNLTGKQVDATELTIEDIYNIRYKINLATKYISYLIEEYGYTEDELNVSGSYYTDIYESYTITTDKIWDYIELGDITISID